MGLLGKGGSRTGWAGEQSAFISDKTGFKEGCLGLVLSVTAVAGLTLCGKSLPM